jgi:hypothetical protein
MGWRNLVQAVVLIGDDDLTVISGERSQALQLEEGQVVRRGRPMREESHRAALTEEGDNAGDSA